MKFDWSEITSLAYLYLINLNIKEFPLSSEKIKGDDGNTLIVSYQKYAKLANIDIDRLNLSGSLNDAYVMKNLPNMPSNMTIILYDNTKISTRTKHSLLHEIGHLKCNHKKHGEKEEKEAHFFASQVNAPNILIKEIVQRGYSLTTSSLKDYFALSEESANKKLDYLKKYNFSHRNEYDDLVLEQFSEFFELKFPPRSDDYYDSYFDDLEKDRNNW